MNRHRLLFVFFIAAFPLAVQAEERSISPNSPCLACHGQRTPTASKKLIDPDVLASSVHSRLACTDCHQTGLRSDESGRPHPQDLTGINCTLRCHQEPKANSRGQSPLYYADSIHGRAEHRGVKEVARCWDCHGKHNILPVSDPQSLANRRNVPLNCSRCHDDMTVVVKYHIHYEKPYAEYRQSVHGRALLEKGLLDFAAVCTDCHGVHNIAGVGTPGLTTRKPETCGRCHRGILEEYALSVHGREALQGNLDAPVCSDCHGEHAIASPQEDASATSRLHIHETCAACHARPELLDKYGIPEKRVTTFIDSLHGIAIGFGQKSAATCSSCHGAHDIRPAADDHSRINPANLASTCGQKDCHPAMPAEIAGAKIHRTSADKSGGAAAIVQKILLALVAAVMALTVIWFIPGLIKRARRLKR